MNTKQSIIILLVLIMAQIVLSNQASERRIPPPIPPVGATHEDAFARALNEPNVFIGVFERVDAKSTLTSGEYVFGLPGIGEATNRFSPLKCIKTIKGKFIEPIIWYTTLSAGIVEGRRGQVGTFFIALEKSKWILALEKTTNAYRVGRFGKDIEQYKYINDDTFFNVLWYEYGALCLKWPEGNAESKFLKKVPETMVGDLEAIVKVMPSIQKEKKDPNDTASINKTEAALKNDLAKSIYNKVLTQKTRKIQDANKAGTITGVGRRGGRGADEMSD
jgi:hypothetical protein